MIREDSTGSITGQIVDSAGLGVPAADLLTCKYTLYDYVTGAVINHRTGIDMLNVNGATVDGSGFFSIPLAAADNPILNAARPSEVHVVLIEFTTATLKGSGDFRYTVTNVTKIPA